MTGGSRPRPEGGGEAGLGVIEGVPLFFRRVDKSGTPVIGMAATSAKPIGSNAFATARTKGQKVRNGSIGHIVSGRLLSESMFSAVHAAPVVVVGENTVQNRLSTRYQVNVFLDHGQSHYLQEANL